MENTCTGLSWRLACDFSKPSGRGSMTESAVGGEMFTEWTAWVVEAKSHTQDWKGP